MNENEWFEDWFDSPYYHILYATRDDNEAALFMNNILGYLKLSNDAKILDLACGRGTHSKFISEKGFDVTGLDLSISSIKHAQSYENEHLTFYSHDMRKPFRFNYFDVILNIFTSFGYFEDEKDAEKTIQNIYEGLKNKGVFVFDFLNKDYVINNIVENEVKNIGDIEFVIKKKIKENWIQKKISFNAKNKKFTYQEKVRLYSQQELISMFTSFGFKIKEIFGNYELERFDSIESKRIIIIATK
jgi:SAM-dependent methyltransferase